MPVVALAHDPLSWAQILAPHGNACPWQPSRLRPILHPDETPKVTRLGLSSYGEFLVGLLDQGAGFAGLLNVVRHDLLEVAQVGLTVRHKLVEELR